MKIDEKDILFGIYRKGDQTGTVLHSADGGNTETIAGSLTILAAEAPDFLELLKSVVYMVETRGDEIRRIASKHKADGTLCVSDGSKGKILS